MDGGEAEEQDVGTIGCIAAVGGSIVGEHGSGDRGDGGDVAMVGAVGDGAIGGVEQRGGVLFREFSGVEAPEPEEGGFGVVGEIGDKGFPVDAGDGR